MIRHQPTRPLTGLVKIDTISTATTQVVKPATSCLTDLIMLGQKAQSYFEFLKLCKESGYRLEPAGQLSKTGRKAYAEKDGVEYTLFGRRAVEGIR
jgi:hypothetical protein